MSALLVTPQAQSFIFWAYSANGSSPAHIKATCMWQVDHTASVQPHNGQLCVDAYNGSFTYPCGDCDIWDMASSPSGSRVVAACSDGLRVFEGHRYSNPRSVLSQNVGFMVVSFKDENIAISGTRAGAVHLTDLRTNHYATRLRHASAVTAVRAINESELLVRGLETVSSKSLHMTTSLRK